MIARPISASIARSISRAINEQEGGGFNPVSLFAAGEQGVWYDPSDLSTLFQDTAGTIPVTAAGQPVGLMRDKSGRGNHATQATATARPILQTDGDNWWLVFDGVDDSLLTGNVSFTTTDKMSIFTGLRKNSDAAGGMLVSHEATAGGAPTFFVTAPEGAAATYGARSGGATNYTAKTPATFAAPRTDVLTVALDNAGMAALASVFGFRVNGASQTPILVGGTTTGGGNYGNSPLRIGRRIDGTLVFNGHLYGIIIRGVASTAQQIADTENWLSAKTGAY